MQGIIDEEFQSSFSGFRHRKPPYVHRHDKDGDYSRLFPGDQKRDGASVYNRRNTNGGGGGGRPGITRHDYRKDIQCCRGKTNLCPKIQGGHWPFSSESFC